MRRVQSIVDSLDVLKSRNLNVVNNRHESVTSGATHCEAFYPECENERLKSMSSTGDPGSDGVNAMPHPAPFPVPYYYPPSNVAYPGLYPTPYHTPYEWMPYQEGAYPMPYNVSAPMPYYDASCVYPYSTGTPSSSQNWERFG